MKYSFYKTGDKEFCNVLVDKSSSNGILKFSHEIDITFVKEGIWKFFSASRSSVHGIPSRPRNGRRSGGCRSLS